MGTDVEENNENFKATTASTNYDRSKVSEQCGIFQLFG
jgi:hypothetical protein